jgi:flavin reductase (DIM6/NTAB) family NADH-FMN oxidoreductase RutF
MKLKLGAFPLLYPIPIVLAGATVAGRANFATIGQCGLMGVNPALVYISSGRDHHTNQGILENGTFSLNLPATDLLAVTDYCGTVSGREVDKSALFDVFYGELETAPMIRECPVNLECRVIQEFSVEHRQIFVGRVIQAHVDEAMVQERDGRQVIAELGRLDPIIYALDNRYYRIGEPIGVGYRESRAFPGAGAQE